MLVNIQSCICLFVVAVKQPSATRNASKKEMESELAVWFGNSRDRGEGSRKATVRVLADSRNQRQEEKESQQMGDENDLRFLEYDGGITEKQFRQETTCGGCECGMSRCCTFNLISSSPIAIIVCFVATAIYLCFVLLRLSFYYVLLCFVRIIVLLCFTGLMTACMPFYLQLCVGVHNLLRHKNQNYAN